MLREDTRKATAQKWRIGARRGTLLTAHGRGFHVANDCSYPMPGNPADPSNWSVTNYLLDFWNRVTPGGL
jgi:hypothetical protein